MKGKLFDASALLNLLIQKGSSALKLLNEQAILDLTVYEVGNSIWRLTHLERKISTNQACSLLDSFLLLTQYMKTLTITGIEKSVKEFSIHEGVTFYDAAYLVAAKNNGLVLVTDDKSLAKVARKHARVIQSSDL